MHVIKYCIFFSVFSQALLAAESESQKWHHQMEMLAQVSAPETSKKVVLDDLSAWGPDQTGALMQLPWWFLDVYSEDESFSGVVGAYFFPAFAENCYELACGQSMGCSLDAMAHAAAMGNEAWRVAENIPSLLISEHRSAMLANLTWKNCAKTCTALLSHWSAAIGYTCTVSANAYAGDPIGWISAVATCQIFKAASITFAGATGILALDGEFIDVALRALRRKYETEDRAEEFAVVSLMIAERKSYLGAKTLEGL